MTIETLTEDERGMMTGFGSSARVDKALRIIDQQAEELAAAKRDVDSSDAGRDAALDLIVEAHNERDSAFDALEIAQARVRELEALNGSANAQADLFAARANKVASDLAALRERVAKAISWLDPGDHLSPRVALALEALRDN